MQIDRRQWLQQSGTGLGVLALAGMMQQSGLLVPSAVSADEARTTPVHSPHFAPRAKHVIHIYLNGGPSQVDTFDPKPLLAKYAGRKIPVGNLATERPTGTALPSPFRFRKYGEAGIEVSEIFSQTAAHVDEMAIIRSMHANTPNHEQSMRLMNCGDERLSRPSYGAWLMYGLGAENQNLPGFVVMCPGYPVSDVSNWRSAFLPGSLQGTHIDTRKTEVDKLIENIRSPYLSQGEQRRQLNLLQQLNRRYQRDRSEDSELEARIASFELAFRMQTAATDVFDLRDEPQAILDLYGPGLQARQMLLARRLIERGVRVVQLYHGDGQPWDAHAQIEQNHRQLAQECDRGIAALLTDLKQRGLLDETLVICGGEFGRTPAVELPQPGTGDVKLGRDHNHWGFTIWLAGGGVKGGTVFGATDEFGYKAVQDPVHVHDLHATLLHLLGIDHERLTYRYAGRDFRLTDVSGHVVDAVLS